MKTDEKTSGVSGWPVAFRMSMFDSVEAEIRMPEKYADRRSKIERLRLVAELLAGAIADMEKDGATEGQMTLADIAAPDVDPVTH